MLIPLEPLYEAFQAENGTVFVLRIQKAGSSTLDALFSTTMSRNECLPNMRRLERVSDPNLVCNRLFNLLHYGTLKEACQDLEGWEAE